MTLTSFLSTAAALAAVLTLIVLCGRIAPRMRFVRQGRDASGRLGLVGSLALDPGRRLLLVQCDGRCVLLLAGQQDQVIGWLPEHGS